MDKIQNSSTGQSVPLWERQKSHRGHKTSVNSALEAHRQRVTERQARIEERLNLAKNISSRFFPKPQISEKPMVEPGQVELSDMQQINVQAPTLPENIIELDAIYDDAQMTPVSQQASHIIEKDLSLPNPEDAPADETPRGSYVDYVV